MRDVRQQVLKFGDGCRVIVRRGFNGAVDAAFLHARTRVAVFYAAMARVRCSVGRHRKFTGRCGSRAQCMSRLRSTVTSMNADGMVERCHHRVEYARRNDK